MKDIKTEYLLFLTNKVKYYLMRLVQKFICCCLLLQFTVAFYAVAAQDTTKIPGDTLYHRYFTIDMFEFWQGWQEKLIDTTLSGFQKYEPLMFAQSLGNTGKAYRHFLFEPRIKRGFSLSTPIYDAYLPNHKDVKYYNVRTPFTDLFYVMGSHKEQLLNVVHTQNISPRFNVGINYNIINSVGAYRRTRSDISNFVAGSHFSTKNNRYKVLGNVIFNKWHNFENSGLTNIQDFKDELLGRPEMYDIRLTLAENRLQERGVFFKQYLNFNKTAVSADTLARRKDDIYNTQLTQAFHWQRKGMIYEDQDPLSGFYPMIYADSNYTGDSLRYNLLSNEIGLNHVILRNRNKEPLFKAGLSLTHQYIDYSSYIANFRDSVIFQAQEKKYFNQFMPQAFLLAKPLPATTLFMEAYMVTGDYNDGDYGFVAGLRTRHRDKHFLEIKWTRDYYQPSYLYNRLFSNHFQWVYDFSKTQLNTYNLLYGYKSFEANLRLSTIDNYVYNNTFARPRQYKNQIQVWKAAVKKNFTLGKLSLDNRLLLQKSSHETLLPLPLFATHQSLYFNTFLFDQALFTQIGIDFYYNTSYYAYDYMPATRSFYLQNHTEIGHYPILDVFVNLYVKSARLFVKAHHLNESISASHKYTTPHYPLQGLSFKFGVSWMFKD